jgi:hypothetical protein
LQPLLCSCCEWLLCLTPKCSISQFSFALAICRHGSPPFSFSLLFLASYNNQQYRHLRYLDPTAAAPPSRRIYPVLFIRAIALCGVAHCRFSLDGAETDTDILYRLHYRCFSAHKHLGHSHTSSGCSERRFTNVGPCQLQAEFEAGMCFLMFAHSTRRSSKPNRATILFAATCSPWGLQNKYCTIGQSSVLLVQGLL